MTVSAERPAIDVVLVSGFLGTGKTTLIRAALSGPGASGTGVIVNEAGDTDFDGVQIAEATGERSAIRMMGNGCLCCEAAGDMAETIRDLVARHYEETGEAMRRIIVEASGLARPGVLLRQFRQLNEFDLRIHVAATVDSTMGAEPDRHSEVAVQWAAANTLILTKSDVADDGGERAMAIAQLINPLAQIVCKGAPDEMAQLGLAPGATELSIPEELADLGEGHGSIHALTLQQNEHASWDACAEWLDNLSGMGGDRILRIKGRLNPADRPQGWLVQAVGTTFAVPVPTAPTATGHLVVIGEDLTDEFLSQVEPLEVFKLKTPHSHGAGMTHGHA